MIRLIAAALSFAFVAPAFAAFPDVPADAHENAEAISYVETRGIVSGYPDGTFKPDITINRAEFLKIVTGAVFTESVIDGCVRSATPVFPDVRADAWFAKYVCTGKVYGIIQGYADGTFKPDRPISFVEAAKIITVALRLNDGLSPGSVWYEHYVRILANKQAVPIGINRFDKSVTRGEVAEIIWRVNVAEHGKPGLTYEDMVAIQTDPVAFYGAKLADRRFTSLYGDGQTWYEAPERLGMIGKDAISELLSALDATDEYERTQALYGLRLAAQHPSVTAFTDGEFPEGTGEAFPPASEHAELTAEWRTWFQTHAANWNGAESIVQLFLIALTDGSSAGPVGCGDDVAPITRTIPRTDSVLTAAIQALIDLDGREIDGLYNAMGNADLQIESVSVASGKATIRLIGEMNLAGVCDEPRVEAQIERTARQFTDITDVEIFLNGMPLGQAIGGRGE